MTINGRRMILQLYRTPEGETAIIQCGKERVEINSTAFEKMQRLLSDTIEFLKKQS